MGATNTSIYDFFTQGVNAANLLGGPNSVTGLGDIPEKLTALPSSGIIRTNLLSQLDAQDMASMINQAVGVAAAGGYNVPMPAEGMTSEQYLSFLNTVQQIKDQMAVEQRASQAQSMISGEYQNLMSDPNLIAAQNLAGKSGMDWDMYETMRRAIDANYNRAGAGANAASRGLAGSSAAQLAGNQAMSQYAGQVAGLYPQAMQASSTLQNEELNRLLAPYMAKSAASSQYQNAMVNVLQALFGSPEFVLSA